MFFCWFFLGIDIICGQVPLGGFGGFKMKLTLKATEKHFCSFETVLLQGLFLTFVNSDN